MVAQNRTVIVNRDNKLWRGQFQAMASDCEVLLECDSRELAVRLCELVASEVWRIEQKYSRYRTDSVIGVINQNKPVSVDAETHRLIDFGFECFELSAGLFDITSGVMQRAWRFDGKTPFPSAQKVTELRELVGLNKIVWHRGEICLPEGMQLDFGGFGKEYATDRALQLLLAQEDLPCLVNLGGDIATNRPPSTQQHWRIGVDGIEDSAMVALTSGGLATSGVSKRFLIHDGKRYGHILNPLSGWPIENPPLSVTVSAPNCTQAGLLATLAMLHGKEAGVFLEQQDCQFHLELDE